MLELAVVKAFCLPVRPSVRLFVCLSVCLIRDPRLKGLRYGHIFHTDARSMLLISWVQIS